MFALPGQEEIFARSEAALHMCVGSACLPHTWLAIGLQRTTTASVWAPSFSAWAPSACGEKGSRGAQQFRASDSGVAGKT